MNHTKEPWERDTCCAIVRCQENDEGARRHVDGGFYRIVAEGNPSDIDRAILCVNALAGIEDPQAWVLRMKRIARFTGDEIEELVEAAKDAEKMINGLLEGYAPTPQQVNGFRAAIQKIRPGVETMKSPGQEEGEVSRALDGDIEAVEKILSTGPWVESKDSGHHLNCVLLVRRLTEKVKALKKEIPKYELAPLIHHHAESDGRSFVYQADECRECLRIAKAERDAALKDAARMREALRLAKRADEVAFDDPGDAVLWTELITNANY